MTNVEGINLTGSSARKITVNKTLLAQDPLIRSAYSGMFAWVIEDDKILILIVPAVRVENGRYSSTQYKMCGGKDDGRMELEWEIMAREWVQECLSENSRKKKKLLLPDIQTESIPCYYHEDWQDQEWQAGYKHRRYFWMLALETIEGFNGLAGFRKVVKEDPDLKGGGREIMLAPTFLDIEELARGLMYKTQLHALAVGIRKLAENDLAYDLLSPKLLEWAALPSHIAPNILQPIYFNG